MRRNATEQNNANKRSSSFSNGTVSRTIVFDSAPNPRGNLITSRSSNAHPRDIQKKSVVGLTRNDIKELKTQELIRLIRQEQSDLSIIVGSEAPQLAHTHHLIQDLLSELLGRWSESKDMAISSISAAEVDLAKKNEQILALFAKIADRDAALASIEAERNSFRSYAQKLEVHLGRIVDSIASYGEELTISEEEGEDSKAKSSRKTPATSSTHMVSLLKGISALPPQIADAVRSLLEPTGPGSVRDGPNSPSSIKEAAEVAERLVNVVKTDPLNVDTFFKSFENDKYLLSSPTAPPPPAIPISAAATVVTTAEEIPEIGFSTTLLSAHSDAPHLPSPSVYHSAIQNLDLMLQRAMNSSSPRASTDQGLSKEISKKLDDIISASKGGSVKNEDSAKLPIASPPQKRNPFKSLMDVAATLSGDAQLSALTPPPPSRSHSLPAANVRSGNVRPCPPAPLEAVVTAVSRSPSPLPKSNEEFASIELEFDRALHARARVAQLRKAVALRLGREPHQLMVNGRVLDDDSATLLTAGVPQKVVIDVTFLKRPINSSVSPVGTVRTLKLNSSPNQQSQNDSSLKQIHVSQPAAPIFVPSKKSPGPQKAPLRSPKPHSPPLGPAGSRRASLMHMISSSTQSCASTERSSESIEDNNNVVLPVVNNDDSPARTQASHVESPPLESSGVEVSDMEASKVESTQEALNETSSFVVKPTGLRLPSPPRTPRRNHVDPSVELTRTNTPDSLKSTTRVSTPPRTTSASSGTSSHNSPPASSFMRSTVSSSNKLSPRRTHSNSSEGNSSVTSEASAKKSPRSMRTASNPRSPLNSNTDNSKSDKSDVVAESVELDPVSSDLLNILQLTLKESEAFLALQVPVTPPPSRLVTQVNESEAEPVVEAELKHKSEYKNGEETVLSPVSMLIDDREIMSALYVVSGSSSAASSPREHLNTLETVASLPLSLDSLQREELTSIDTLISSVVEFGEPDVRSPRSPVRSAAPSGSSTRTVSPSGSLSLNTRETFSRTDSIENLAHPAPLKSVPPPPRPPSSPFPVPVMHATAGTMNLPLSPLPQSDQNQSFADQDDLNVTIVPPSPMPPRPF